MFLPFLLFFLDFIAFFILNRWLLHCLLAYFLLLQVIRRQAPIFTLKFFFWPLFLFLLQDNFLNGRVGIGLVYLLPALFFCRKIRSCFNPEIRIFYFIPLIFALLFQDLVIKRLLLQQNVVFYSTIIKIFINIII